MFAGRTIACICLRDRSATLLIYLVIPPSTKYCAYEGQGCRASHLGVNYETFSVNTILILNTGVLQPQVGMEEFRQGKGCFLTSLY